MKKYLAALLAVLLLFTCMACGGSAKSVDAQALADALHNGVHFTAQMSALPADQIGFMMAEMPASYTAAGYAAGGTSVEEILVIVCTGADDAKLVRTSVQTHIDELREQANKYDPASVALIDGAVFVAQGNAVALCITSDSDAASAIVKEQLQ